MNREASIEVTKTEEMTEDNQSIVPALVIDAVLVDQHGTHEEVDQLHYGNTSFAHSIAFSITHRLWPIPHQVPLLLNFFLYAILFSNPSRSNW